MQNNFKETQDVIKEMQIILRKVEMDVNAWLGGTVVTLFPKWLKIKYNIEITRFSRLSRFCKVPRINYLLYGRQDGQEVILLIETIARCRAEDIQRIAIKRKRLESWKNKKVRAFMLFQSFIAPAQEEAQKHGIELLAYPMMFLDLLRA